ncbi:MAG: PLD nuclease N-terminal domain-containing protein [Desulfovibrio sp.]|uniref:PLD nuclease N-terminal domain-containing protein n=1 Tax=Desulfovibrio sp. 7SRBS1 TaxID=3378064 RepID=UPI003B3D1126
MNLSLSSSDIVTLLLVVALFVLLSWWSIRDAYSRDFGSGNEKFFWLQISVLIPFIGCLLYLFIGRKRGRKNT